MDYMEEFAELVRGNGDNVEINTSICVLHKAEHENCDGCASELGCAKYVSILGISMTPMLYQPKDFYDYQQMQESIQDKIDVILNAKTADEVKAVKW